MTSIADHVALQEALQKLGYLKLTAKLDGVYGPETRSAIIRWQLAQQLPLTGILNKLAAEDLFLGIRNEVATRVLACYNNTYREAKKLITIRQMKDCAGVLITPRALMICALNGLCPALPDTSGGRAVFEAALAADGLGMDSELMLSKHLWPARRDRSTTPPSRQSTLVFELGAIRHQRPV